MSCYQVPGSEVVKRNQYLTVTVSFYQVPGSEVVRRTPVPGSEVVNNTQVSDTDSELLSSAWQ
jgi:hypothetical protein